MCLIVIEYLIKIMGVTCDRLSKQISISNELYTSRPNSNVFWNHTWKSAQWRALLDLLDVFR